jgi:hypothetical protein
MVFRGDQMEHDRWPAELDKIFAEYRSAVIEPEPSPEFMPTLWSRIDQNRRFTYSFRRIASGFVTAAAAICLVLSVVSWTPSQAPISAATYVEILADSTADAGLDQ